MRFCLADVFLPNDEDLRAIFHEEEALEGTVIDFSDSGSRPNAFAIIEVIQKQTLVVPVERLQPGSGCDAVQNIRTEEESRDPKTN